MTTRARTFNTIAVLATLLVLTLAPAAHSALTDNLELYYSFNNDTSDPGGVHDNSGSYRAGTGQGGGIEFGGPNNLTTLQFSTDVPGPVGAGRCLVLTNTQDYVAADSPGYLGVLGSADRTVACWYRYDTNATVFVGDTIVDWGLNAAGNRFTFKLNGNAANGPVGVIRVEVQGGRSLGSTVLTNGQWYHMAAVFANTGAPGLQDVKFYINGLPETISVGGTSPVNTVGFTNVVIGNANLANGAAFYNRSPQGWLDEVGIWSRALTPAEIASLAAGTVVPTPAPIQTVRVETAANGTGALVAGQVLASGASLTAYAIFRDSAGNFLSNGVASWSLIAKANGVVDGDLVASGTSATFTANASGSCRIQATAAGFSGLISGTLIVQRNLVWRGDGSGNQWNILTTPNWRNVNNLATPVTFVNGDSVSFEDGGAANTTVNLNTTVLPQSVAFEGSASYTLTGTGGLGGGGALSNLTSGTTILLTSNPNTVFTYIGNGTLQVGNGGTVGNLGTSTAQWLGSAGKLVLKRSDAITLGQRIFGATATDYGLMDVSSGTVTLTGGANQSFGNDNTRAHVASGATLIMSKVAWSVDAGNDDTTPMLLIDAGGTARSAAGTNNNLGRGSVTVNGMLDLNGHNESANGLLGTGVVDNSSASNCVLTIGGNNFSHNSGESFAGVLRNTGGGTLGLTKNGAGTISLSGTNTYSGATTVNNGVLQLNHPATLAPKTSVYLSTLGGALDLNFSGTNQVAGLYIDGVAQPAGVYDSSTSPITGTGSLKVVPIPSQPTILPVTVSGTNLVVSVPTASGFNYVLQSATNLTPVINWQNESTNAGTGGNLILNVPIDPAKPHKFLRFWVY